MTTLRPEPAPRPIDFHPRLAARIREARAVAGLTQRDISARTGLRPDRLSKYENGSHPPTLYALAQIAAALGVPPDQLMPETTVLPLETDRDFYRLCRKIWFYPPTVRATCAQVLRGLCDFYDLTVARAARSIPEGGRHASRV